MKSRIKLAVAPPAFLGDLHGGPLPTPRILASAQKVAEAASEHAMSGPKSGLVPLAILMEPVAQRTIPAVVPSDPGGIVCAGVPPKRRGVRG